jgi:hypothetical protein
MKRQALPCVAVFALVLAAMPAAAQDSPSSPKLTDIVSQLFGSHKSGAVPKSAKTSKAAAVSAGVLHPAKVFKFASVDYPGASTSIVFDENSAGLIVGDTQFSELEGFTLKGNNYQLLEIPSLANEIAGINTSGEMVGAYADNSGIQHGFLYNNGVVTNIDDPNAAIGQTTAVDINDGGEIVGFYADASGVTHGFYTLDSGVTFNDVDFPGAIFTEAVGINTSGAIVGQWQDVSNNLHGFLFSAGTYRSLDCPGGTATTALGINDSQEISGHFQDANMVYHGFIYSRGEFAQVDVAGATGTQLARIKNSGLITGVYFDQLNETHGMTGH